MRARVSAGIARPPVVVLSNNDGCVIARSNEAKALGIEMGAPWHLHRARFAAAGVIVRSSNYTLYGDMSSRVMQVLSPFTPDLEIYSIDEAFLGMDGFGARLEAHARGRCARRAAMDRHSGIDRHCADQDARQGRQSTREKRPRIEAACRCCSTKRRRMLPWRAWR